MSISGPKRSKSPIELRRIGPGDCFAALREGFDDFMATPTHVAFVGIFYAVAGIVLAALSSFANALHLIFPLAAGFALIGPFFAVGLYELSRRREAGLPASWRDAFAVFRSPALPSVIMLGLFLLALFALWIGTAQYLYTWLYGPKAPAAAAPYLHDVLTTSRGWTLILVGGAIGFCFAAVSLMISVVAFPLMLDRDVGLAPAIVASTRLTRDNPGPVALWGAIVVAALVVGSLPLFIGLAVVMPVARPRDLALLPPRGRARPGARGPDRGPDRQGPRRGAGFAAGLDVPRRARLLPQGPGVARRRRSPGEGRAPILPRSTGRRSPPRRPRSSACGSGRACRGGDRCGRRNSRAGPAAGWRARGRDGGRRNRRAPRRRRASGRRSRPQTRSPAARRLPLSIAALRK